MPDFTQAISPQMKSAISRFVETFIGFGTPKQFNVVITRAAYMTDNTWDNSQSQIKEAITNLVYAAERAAQHTEPMFKITEIHIALDYKPTRCDATVNLRKRSIEPTLLTGTHLEGLVSDADDWQRRTGKSTETKSELQDQMARALQSTGFFEVQKMSSTQFIQVSSPNFHKIQPDDVAKILDRKFAGQYELSETRDGVLVSIKTAGKSDAAKSRYLSLEKAEKLLNSTLDARSGKYTVRREGSQYLRIIPDNRRINFRNRIWSSLDNAVNVTLDTEPETGDYLLRVWPPAGKSDTPYTAFNRERYATMNRSQLQVERQRVANSLREGEMRLKSKRDGIGEKLTAGQLAAVERSVAQERASVAAIDEALAALSEDKTVKTGEKAMPDPSPFFDRLEAAGLQVDMNGAYRANINDPSGKQLTHRRVIEIAGEVPGLTIRTFGGSSNGIGVEVYAVRDETKAADGGRSQIINAIIERLRRAGLNDYEVAPGLRLYAKHPIQQVHAALRDMLEYLNIQNDHSGRVFIGIIKPLEMGAGIPGGKSEKSAAVDKTAIMNHLRADGFIVEERNAPSAVIGGAFWVDWRDKRGNKVSDQDIHSSLREFGLQGAGVREDRAGNGYYVGNLKAKNETKAATPEQVYTALIGSLFEVEEVGDALHVTTQGRPLKLAEVKQALKAIGADNTHAERVGKVVKVWMVETKALGINPDSAGGILSPEEQGSKADGIAQRVVNGLRAAGYQAEVIAENKLTFTRPNWKHPNDPTYAERKETRQIIWNEAAEDFTQVWYPGDNYFRVSIQRRIKSVSEIKAVRDTQGVATMLKQKGYTAEVHGTDIWVDDINRQGDQFDESELIGALNAQGLQSPRDFRMEYSPSGRLKYIIVTDPGAYQRNLEAGLQRKTIKAAAKDYVMDTIERVKAKLQAAGLTWSSGGRGVLRVRRPGFNVSETDVINALRGEINRVHIAKQKQTFVQDNWIEVTVLPEAAEDRLAAAREIKAATLDEVYTALVGGLFEVGFDDDDHFLVTASGRPLKTAEVEQSLAALEADNIQLERAGKAIKVIVSEPQTTKQAGKPHLDYLEAIYLMVEDGDSLSEIASKVKAGLPGVSPQLIQKVSGAINRAKQGNQVDPEIALPMLSQLMYSGMR